MKLKAIARTKDSDDPVFKLTNGESYMTFMALGDHVRVHHVYSETKGDFKLMMDRLVKAADCENVEFWNVLGDNLEDVLYDYDRVDVETPKGKADVIICTWHYEE